MIIIARIAVLLVFLVPALATGESGGAPEPVRHDVCAGSGASACQELARKQADFGRYIEATEALRRSQSAEQVAPLHGLDMEVAEEIQRTQRQQQASQERSAEEREARAEREAAMRERANDKRARLGFGVLPD